MAWDFDKTTCFNNNIILYHIMVVKVLGELQKNCAHYA